MSEIEELRGRIAKAMAILESVRCMKDADDSDVAGWLPDEAPSVSFVTGIAWRVLNGDEGVGDGLICRLAEFDQEG